MLFITKAYFWRIIASVYTPKIEALLINIIYLIECL